MEKLRTVITPKIISGNNESARGGIHREEDTVRNRRNREPRNVSLATYLKTHKNLGDSHPRKDK